MRAIGPEFMHSCSLPMETGSRVEMRMARYACGVFTAMHMLSSKRGTKRYPPWLLIAAEVHYIAAIALERFADGTSIGS